MTPKILSFPIFILLMVLLGACTPKQTSLTHQLPHSCDYYSLKAAQCLNKEEMIRRLEPYKVIFIGDHHDQTSLHANIAELISSFSRQGVRIKLANEWFYPQDREVLDRYASSEINATEFSRQIAWDKRFSSFPFDSFHPIYQAVRDTKGDLYGINLTMGERRKISDQNLSVMNEEELDFNTHLDLDVSVHRQLVMPYLQHCHAPKKGESNQACAERMYRVQVAWDTKMAMESFRLAKTLKDNEKLIVFAGAMHIENNLGIPLRFSRLTPIPYASIIPLAQGNEKTHHAIGDFLLFYPKTKIK